jgi:hypothetical protein
MQQHPQGEGRLGGGESRPRVVGLGGDGGEDLFGVLEKRIAQQCEDLKAHRQSIENTIELDVQQLEVRVKQDEAELQSVYTKYRDALDELARLRALTCTLQMQVDEADVVRAESVASVEEAREIAQEAERQHAAELASIQDELQQLRQRQQKDTELECKVEVLQEALAAAKTQADGLHDAQAESAALNTRLRAAIAAGEAAAAELQHERQKGHLAAAAAIEARTLWEQALRDMALELAAARQHLVLVSQCVHEDAEGSARVASDALERAREAERRREDDKAERKAAEERLALARGEVETLKAELVHKASALTLAAEQLEHAEIESQAASDKLLLAQEQALAAESASSSASATAQRLERELEEQAREAASLQDALVRAHTQLQQLGSGVSADGDGSADGGGCAITSTSARTTSTSSSSSSSMTSSMSKTSTTTSKTIERSSCTTTSSLPSGGEVAQGIGVMVTINNKERETVTALQTTIKQKEKEVVVLRTELKSTQAALGDAKAYWKAAQVA